MRRRALLAGSAAGLTSLAGCADVFSDTDRSGSTVNPQLQGEPTTGRPAAVAWRANTADPQAVYPAGDAVVVTENNQQRFRALSTDNGATLWTATFEESRRAFPGEVIVVFPSFGDDTVVGLDAATGEQLWEVDAPGGVSTVTSEFVVVGATNDTDRTAVYDRRDGSRLWQTPLGERHLSRTDDPVITFTARPTTDTESSTENGTPMGTDTGTPGETGTGTPMGTDTGTPGETVVETATGTATQTATETDVGTATRTATETDVGTTTQTPTPVTPAPTSDDRPSRIQGRDPTTGRLLWSVAAPFDARQATPVGPHDGRLLLVDDGEYLLFGTTEGLIAEGSLPDDLRPEFTSIAGGRVYFGNPGFGAVADGAARLGWVDLDDGTSAVRAVRGESVYPLQTGDGRLLTLHWGDPGYGVVRRDPADGTASWSVSGVPIGYRSGGLVVGTPGEVRSHTSTGGVRWRADNPVGGPFGSLLGDADANATGIVRDDRVVVVSETGVASWDRDDGRSRTEFTPLDGVETLTITTDGLLIVVFDGTVTAVEV